MEKLKNKIQLCIGLDTDLDRLPTHLSKDDRGILEFNRSIIEATQDIADVYKINFAFYERLGASGFEAIKKTFEMLHKSALSIADAKRADIGNTSKAYADAIFNYIGADSVTVNPYMGYDSLQPFLEYHNKIVFILLLTSNKGSYDFQRIEIKGTPLYFEILKKTNTWNSNAEIGYVVGATHPNELHLIHNASPNSIFLIPGVGTQGGSLDDTAVALNGGSGIINISRDIIFASNGKDFAEQARKKAEYYKNKLLKYNDI